MVVSSLNAWLRQRLHLLPMSFCVLAMTAWVMVTGSALFRADIMSMAARQKVDTWARLGTGWTVEEWQAARADLLSALRLTPRDPVLHETLGQMYAAQGLAGWDDPSLRAAFFEEARVHQQASLALRPGHGATWAALAVSLFALQRPAVEFQQAWDQAHRLAPHELSVQTTLADLVFATWDTAATPEMQNWVKQCWAQATPNLKAALLASAQRYGHAGTLQ